MKFGERFEEASVPGWSLHNVDYNSLKHQIKVRTTKDQATAIAIPGHQDYALKRFEDDFYLEILSQHNRVGLFVISKADEISRRLHHLSNLVHHLMLKCGDTRGLSDKRQRRFVRYHTLIEECGRDIKALGRFVDAQVTAFRKILKKYKKWTGSTTLSSRFKDDILDHPKSFINYNFSPLQLQYRELRSTLEAASPINTNVPEPPPPSESCNPSDRRDRRDSRRSSQSVATTTPTTPTTTYWNEYDNGSEAGDHDDAYVIYVDPNADDDFPGLAYVKSMLGGPVDSVRHWLRSQKSKDTDTTVTVSTPSETQSLLGRSHGTSNGAPTDYFGTAARHAPIDEPMTEDECLSSHSSISSEIDLKMARYQDRVLTRGIILAFVAAFVLLGVSGLLVATGRRRLRLEVDAGAAVGSVASLFCACMGLGAMLYRQSPAGYLYNLAVWVAFITDCVLNGILLVSVVSSSGL